MANLKGSEQRELKRQPALTRQRQVVLQVVRSEVGHLTANEVFAAARMIMPTISFATVYNSLRFLKDAGLISEITFGNAASRFDRETTRHDHAICSRCGTLVDFDFPEISDLLQKAATRTQFSPERLHLTLVGVCPACRAVSSEPNKP